MHLSIFQFKHYHLSFRGKRKIIDWIADHRGWLKRQAQIVKCYFTSMITCLMDGFMPLTKCKSCFLPAFHNPISLECFLYYHNHPISSPRYRILTAKLFIESRTPLHGIFFSFFPLVKGIFDKFSISLQT